MLKTCFETDNGAINRLYLIQVNAQFIGTFSLLFITFDFRIVEYVHRH